MNPETSSALLWNSFKGQNFSVRIHENRTTMLSVRWEPGRTKVSLHRMFLQAPEEVQRALNSYFARKKRKIPPIVRAYIEENVGKQEYVRRPPPETLLIQGTYYNLQEVYDGVNRMYFSGELDLSLTWFGKKHASHRSSFTFGLYDEARHLVKIHRKLDDPDVPYHVLSFVMYHEMLHSLCPTQVREDGKTRIHTPEFKKREKEFAEYRFAKDWIQHNKQRFFYGIRR